MNLIDEMNRPGSPQFHQWLTAADFGRRFGPSQQDIGRITDWLASHGFRIDSVLPSGMVIEFSGTAGQVRGAFHTEIHSLQANGESHIANMGDPQIPAALAAAVKGIVSLHDFRPHQSFRKRAEFQVVSGSSIYEAVAPADLATIYNLNPLFAAGIKGTGQTVVVIEDTLLKNVSDVATFRSAFGLSGGSFSQKLATGGWPSVVTAGGSGDEYTEADAEVERAMQTLFSTPAGSNVSVAPAQLSTLTFTTVTSAGLTSVVATSPSPGTTIAPGFQIVNGLTYDVITTAAIKDQITACFTVPWITDGATFANVRVLHLENGVLVDRTLLEAGPLAPDFGRRRVCDLTASLSPFAIALHTSDTTPRSMTIELTPAVLRPTGRLVTVRATIHVSDETDLAPTVRLVSIMSSERPDEHDIVGAAIGTDDRVFQIRAEPMKHGRPLLYTVVDRASDASGNTRDVSATVVVQPKRD